MPKCAKTFQNMPNQTKMCLILQKYHIKIPKYVKIYQMCHTLPKCAKPYTNMPIHIKICQTMPKCAKTFQNMPNHTKMISASEVTFALSLVWDFQKGISCRGKYSLFRWPPLEVILEVTNISCRCYLCIVLGLGLSKRIFC